VLFADSSLLTAISSGTSCGDQIRNMIRFGIHMRVNLLLTAINFGTSLLHSDFYKIFVYFEAVVHDATILSPPPPPPLSALPTLVQYYCTIIGQYTTSLLTSRLFAIHHTILVITISCKGQGSSLHNGGKRHETSRNLHSFTQPTRSITHTHIAPRT